MNGPPVSRAGVLIDDAGRIAALGPDDTVPRPYGTPQLDLPDAVLLPGLINTHTHLELTGFAGRADQSDFPEWIQAVRRLKAERTAAEYLDAARRGLRACWAAGITTIADTGDSGAVVRALAEYEGSGIVYHEVFGPHPDQLAESVAGLRARLEELGALATGRVRLGVSPHAPYTVSGPLYGAAAALAREAALPLAVHVAESPAEQAFVVRREGPFAEAWKGRSIPLLDDAVHRPPPGGPGTPVAWLAHHGVLGPDTLCIHVVQADAEDVARLAEAGAAVAHCPLSNRRHRHGDAPLGALLAAGLRVGLGTDSEASVGTLDLLAEARAAREIGWLDAEEALRLCTVEGARALGGKDARALGGKDARAQGDAAIGVLEPGAWGDVVALAVGADRTADPYEAALAASLADVKVTVIAGRVVHARDDLAPPDLPVSGGRS